MCAMVVVLLWCYRSCWAKNVSKHDGMVWARRDMQRSSDGRTGRGQGGIWHTVVTLLVPGLSDSNESPRTEADRMRAREESMDEALTCRIAR